MTQGPKCGMIAELKGQAYSIRYDAFDFKILT